MKFVSWNKLSLKQQAGIIAVAGLIILIIIWILLGMPHDFQGFK